MKIKIPKNILSAGMAICGAVSNHAIQAEELPRPELGCRVIDSDGSSMNPADYSFQQRIAVGRCMNMAERDKEAEAKLMKSQRQSIENANIMRRSENQLAISGYQAPWRPYGSPHRVPGIPGR